MLFIVPYIFPSCNQMPAVIAHVLIEVSFFFMQIFRMFNWGIYHS